MTLRRTIRSLLAEGLARDELLVVLLTYADGLTDSEIASALGGSVAEISRRRRSAIESIRRAVAAAA